MKTVSMDMGIAWARKEALDEANSGSRKNSVVVASLANNTLDRNHCFVEFFVLSSSDSPILLST